MNKNNNKYESIHTDMYIIKRHLYLKCMHVIQKTIGNFLNEFLGKISY